MLHLDLFSGIGGFSLGLEREGFKTAQFVEIDPHAVSVLETHWPSVPIHKDVKTFVPKERYTIVTGGFPCQDISVAGKRAGIFGSRSGLWGDFNRIIREGRPKYVIIENSPNLRNLGFEVVLKDLWESGYDAEWYVLGASQFGAVHRRERIFIVAYPSGTRRERLVSNEHLEKIGQRGMCRKETVQSFYENLFERSGCWPKPLLRREDDGVPGRVDRLRLVGNSVYPPIVSWLGSIIREDLNGRPD